MARIPLHNVLDTILGFSIRDMVLETPEDVEEFRRMLREKIDELRRRDASKKEPQEKE
ncbi:MAG: hypothetical protein BWY93_02015 [Euryarchaeota archaeon ADurb.BinA087]|nr:MAG: hypothetical protein BWY93_02015 [Euryarchaeota archaeon ADurb.BinA087]HNR50897.1 hypothetical protein [Deltaproteobacteria bacterium]HOD72686.1 hypothetical protein [Deltaproteobacteria bacterium]HPA08550.1 hypothetical protein [Methanoregulaceae archaeon]